MVQSEAVKKPNLSTISNIDLLDMLQPDVEGAVSVLDIVSEFERRACIQHRQIICDLIEGVGSRLNAAATLSIQQGDLVGKQLFGKDLCEKLVKYINQLPLITGAEEKEESVLV